MPHALTPKSKLVAVGYGYIGSRICGLISGQRHTQASWRKPSSMRLEIAAIVEPNQAKADVAARVFPDVPVVCDVSKIPENVLTDPSVFIRDFAPLSQRAHVLEFAKECGLDILLEKPIPLLCFGPAYGQGKVRVGVGMSEVRNPVIGAVRFLISRYFAKVFDIKIARVNSVHQLRSEGSSIHRSGVEGGAFLDKMIHDVHLLDQGYYLGKQARSFTLDAVNDTIMSSSEEDIYSDVDLHLETERDDVTVRLISSWIGVPRDLSHRLGIDQALIDASVLHYRLDDSNLSVENLKIAVIKGVGLDGAEITLVANLQSRHRVSAGIWIIRGGLTQFREIRFNVPIVSATKSFAGCSSFTTIEETAVAHKLAYEVRKAISRYAALQTITTAQAASLS